LGDFCLRRIFWALAFVIVGLPIWYLGFTYVQDRIYGIPPFRSIVYELKTRPDLVHILEVNGLAPFDVGPKANVSFDGRNGYYSFATTGKVLSVDEIMRNATRLPIPRNRSDFDARLKLPPNDSVFRVEWHVSDDTTSLIDRMLVGERVLYERTSPN
jgi:hypothetical protein